MTVSDLVDEFQTADTVPGLPKRRTHKAAAARNERMLALPATGMTIDEVAAAEGITRSQAYGGLAKMTGYRDAMNCSRQIRYSGWDPSQANAEVAATDGEGVGQRLGFKGAIRRPGEGPPPPGGRRRLNVVQLALCRRATACPRMVLT